jgi:hypothetical protein
MAQKRVMLTVKVSLDPVPGVMHTQESACDYVQSILENQMPHYNPTVRSINMDVEAAEMLRWNDSVTKLIEATEDMQWRNFLRSMMF